MKKRLLALLLAAMLSANLLYVPAAALEADAGAGPAEEISVPDTVEPAPAPEDEAEVPADTPEDLPGDAPEDVPVDGNVPEEEPAAPETENAPGSEASPAPQEPAASEPAVESTQPPETAPDAQPTPDQDAAPDAELAPDMEQEVSPTLDPAIGSPEPDEEAGEAQTATGEALPGQQGEEGYEEHNTVALGETAPVEEDIVASGYCGWDANWTLDSNGTLTISGSGAIRNFTYSNVNAQAYIEQQPWGRSIRNVVIEEG